MENKLQIFKNPLDIPRDDLLRHLIYLPVQVATALDSRCARVRGKTTSTMRTPLIRVLECHISKQDGLQESTTTGKYIKPSNSMLPDCYCEEKNCAIGEACLEGEIGPMLQQKKQESNVENLVGGANLITSGFTIQSTATDSQSHVLLSKTSSSSRSEEHLSVCCDKEGLEMEQVKQGVSGETDGKNKRKRDSDLQVKLKENSYNKASSEYNSSARESSPIVKMDIDRQTNFLISTIRILRNSKPNQSKELLDFLSSSNLPMKKEHLVEQLIWMAKEYNKKTLVEELMKYRYCENCSSEIEKK